MHRAQCCVEHDLHCAQCCFKYDLYCSLKISQILNILNNCTNKKAPTMSRLFYGGACERPHELFFLSSKGLI